MPKTTITKVADVVECNSKPQVTSGPPFAEHDEVRPIGKIKAVNLRSADTLFGDLKPWKFSLDRRHRLEVRSCVHGWSSNEYVAARVLGNGQAAGMVLVRTRDIELVRPASEERWYLKIRGEAVQRGQSE